MKIPLYAILIPAENLTKYLLVYKVEDDKSIFLKQAGFTLDTVEVLEGSLIQHVYDSEAEVERKHQNGTLYRMQGELVGLDGRVLNICSVWLHDELTGKFRFLTLYPRR